MSKELNKDIKIAETTETKVEKTKEVSREERKMRRAQTVDNGRLYIDEKHKEKGYVYRIVNDKPGRIKHLENLGYDIVRDNTKVGSGSMDTPSKLGSAVTVETGIHLGSMTGVLMRIPQDEYDEAQRDKAAMNDAALNQATDTGIPTQYGESTLRKG